MSRFIQLGLLLGLVLSAPPPARAQLAERDVAEELVRAQYFEGLPYGEARELTAAGIERLVEMLRDPAEAEHHDNIVMALGISGDPQAYPALIQFHDDPPEGEIDSAAYRARRALPLAMGHLARSDPRAFQFLLDAVDARAVTSVPEWSYRHLAGERLEGILRRAAITGVAMSGQPEAVAALRRLGERARDDPSTTDELRGHVAEAERLCDRVVREGPDPVFGSGAAP